MRGGVTPCAAMTLPCWWYARMAYDRKRCMTGPASSPLLVVGSVRFRYYLGLIVELNPPGFGMAQGPCELLGVGVDCRVG